MDDERVLKDKALHLLRAERDRLAIRQRYEQTASWLRLSHSLPQIVDHKLPPAELYSRISRAMVTGLRLQRASFFTLRPGELLLITNKETATPRPLGPEAQAILAAERAGVCNEPNDAGSTELAAAVGLHRFVWASLRISESEQIMLVAGFDRERAVFQGSFDDGHVSQLASLGQHIEILIRNAMLLSELERDKERLQRFNETLEQRVLERTQELARAVATLEEKDARLAEDLRQACQFQQRILPVLKRHPRIRFEAVYRPLDLVGGDIYDVCEIARDLHRVLIADVTGHGVQASLRTIVLKGEYDRIKRDHPRPDALLYHLNHQLASTYSQGEMLSTACCLDLDLGGPHPILRYSCAAHPPPIRISGSGAVEQTECFGPYMAAAGIAVEYRLVEVALESGDLVLAYSDGLSDQRGPEPAAFFDLGGTLGKIALRSQPLPELLELLLNGWEDFRGSTPVDDDLTIVAAQVE